LASVGFKNKEKGFETSMNWIETFLGEHHTAFWTIFVASMVSVMCAWLGVWLVIQRLSMLGDAISHSVLPGLVMVFVFFGTRAPLPMALGAGIAALLTVFLTKAVSQSVKVREDASMGVVFTVLFAVGVLLITRFASQIDLDPSCVLYGQIEFVSIDTFPIGRLEVPEALLTVGPAFILTFLFLWVFRRELLIMAFDPMLGEVLGKYPALMYYLLMSVVAFATVASFEPVGSILVIAMLVGPAATAQLLTRRLKSVFMLSTGVAILSAVTGYFLAERWDTSIAGMMAVTLGVLYVLAAVGVSLKDKVLLKSMVKA
jgi:manganese/zinc/iron transport system permease protein